MRTIGMSKIVVFVALFAPAALFAESVKDTAKQGASETGEAAKRAGGAISDTAKKGAATVRDTTVEGAKATKEAAKRGADAAQEGVKQGTAAAKEKYDEKNLDNIAAVDINTASENELEALPGVGEARAKKIVEGRPYDRKDQLITKGILTKSTYGKIRDHIVAAQPRE